MKYALLIALVSVVCVLFSRIGDDGGEGDKLKDGRLGNRSLPLFVKISQVLSSEGSEQFMEYIRRYSILHGWGQYSSEGLTNGFGEAKPRSKFPFQKCPLTHAISLNKTHCIFRENMGVHLYAISGGRHKNPLKLSVEELGQRNDFFRETLAYGNTRLLPDPVLETFFNNTLFIAAAREVFGASAADSVVEPWIIYVNFVLPGQELVPHTDVPEFRGANRKNVPQWMLVAMHHSQLFDHWRIPMATAVSWWANRLNPVGGDFVLYPRGVRREPDVWNVGFNEGVVMDTDSTAHGVDYVHGPFANMVPGMRLSFNKSAPESEAWVVSAPGESPVARYSFDQTRLSISWKAYVFSNSSERDLWLSHKDDLNFPMILDMFKSDLRARNKLPNSLDMEAFGYLLLKEYIKFPTS